MEGWRIKNDYLTANQVIHGRLLQPNIVTLFQPKPQHHLRTLRRALIQQHSTESPCDTHSLLPIPLNLSEWPPETQQATVVGTQDLRNSNSCY